MSIEKAHVGVFFLFFSFCFFLVMFVSRDGDLRRCCDTLFKSLPISVVGTRCAWMDRWFVCLFVCVFSETCNQSINQFTT